MELILNAILEDLARGLPDAVQVARLVVRLLAAMLLGGMIGWERERQEQAAGLRTHMLICMGATLFVLLPAGGGFSSDGLSRVIQGVASGIGFLGAGTILKRTERGEIRGLTTAAGIWMTAAVGVALGLGQLGAAIVSTILCIFILNILRRMKPHSEADDKPIKGSSEEDEN